MRQGETAVVTGAASGIGLALARSLGARGATVWMLDVEADALGAAAAMLAAEGAAVFSHPCDVTDAFGMEQAAKAIHRHGPVDLLVNNAGVGGVLAPTWATSPQDWAWVLGVNLGGVVNGVRAFVPAMIARGHGHVLNMASLAGLTAPPFMTPYVASKHAVVALTESLTAELATLGAAVTASVAVPGNVESRIQDSGRNRPPLLRSDDPLPPPMRERLETGFAPFRAQGLIPAEVAAERILDGLIRGDRMIVTHPDEMQPARERLTLLARSMPAV